MMAAKLDNFALARRIRAGDMAARDEMIVGNMGLVFDLARKIPGSHIDRNEWDNLVQEGCVGLIEAVDGFDPKRGIKFSHYARFNIRRRLIECHLKSKYRVVDVPIGIAAGKPRYGRGDIDNVCKAKVAKGAVPIWMFDVVDDDDDSVGTACREDENAWVLTLVNRLRGKEQAVIRTTYLMGEYRTRTEVARVLGLSRSSVEVYIERAYRKLRQYARCS